MTFWKWMLGSLNDAAAEPSAPTIVEDTGSTVNPATGLPMLSGGMSGVDIGGSPFGTDMHSIESWDSNSKDGSWGGSTLD